MGDQLTFALGLGLEHFAIRQEDRKVWLSAQKTSQVATSGGIPMLPPLDPSRPFFMIGELREGDYNSTCRSATAACAASTAVGAARDLKYDTTRGCLVLDNWAPVRMSQAT